MRVGISNMWTTLVMYDHIISLRREVWAHEMSLTGTKPGELQIFYVVFSFRFCHCFYSSLDFMIIVWNYFDSVLFCVILLLCNHYNWDMNDYYTSSVWWPQAHQAYQLLGLIGFNIVIIKISCTELVWPRWVDAVEGRRVHWNQLHIIKKKSLKLNFHRFLRKMYYTR